MHQRILAIAIPCFCVLQIAAVGSYTVFPLFEGVGKKWLGMDADATISADIKTTLRPYILATSQWQKWNLFSPDPLRRVTRIVLEEKVGTDWQLFTEFSDDTVPWWRKAYTLKMMRRLEEKNIAVQKRWLELQCAAFDVIPRRAIRMRRVYYVIPRDGRVVTPAFWKDWEPQFYDEVLAETFCPATP